MRDLYATEQMAGSPEEISTFISHLLHCNNSSSSSPKFSNSPLVAFSHPPPDAAPSSSVGYRLAMPETHRPDALNYSDSGSFMWKEKRASSENDDVEKGPEMPADAVRHRSSSKRSRTAEIHNMSEKRRRSRINEKMKALQNLIPNSNKVPDEPGFRNRDPDCLQTDKASMLDEAIEYLKQLQLQVQMLTMRNGLSLHPMCAAGGVQPPMVGLSIEESGSGYPFSQEKPELLPMTRPPQCAISNDAILVPGSSFGFEPLYGGHYGGAFASTSVKEVNSHGHHQTDTDRTMKPNTSSRVS